MEKKECVLQGQTKKFCAKEEDASAVQGVSNMLAEFNGLPRL